MNRAEKFQQLPSDSARVCPACATGHPDAHEVGNALIAEFYQCGCACHRPLKGGQ